MLTAAYKRPEIFNIFMENFRYLREQLKGKIDLSLLIVGEETDPCYEVFNRKFIDCTYWVECENKPLGKKWNVGLTSASVLEFDYIFLNDTDTIFNSKIFDTYIDFIVKGYDYIGVSDIYFLDYKSKKAIYSPLFTESQKGRSIGPGRMLSRAICEKVNWILWDNTINIRLNSSMNEKLEKVSCNWVTFSCRNTSNFVMDIKSEQNLWPFSHYEKKGLKQDSKRILQKYLPSLQSELILNS